MPGPACLLPCRLRFLALCLLLPVFLAHCSSFKPQSRKASNDAAAVKEAPDDKKDETTSDDNKDESPSEEEASKKDEEEPKVSENQRIIAVDQTPFFRWLRSGLRSNAKPSRYLKMGELVELLKEHDEEKFSQIRLANRKKGWVPSRLLKEPTESAPPKVPGTSATQDPTEQTAISEIDTDTLTPANPAQLPTDPGEVQPSLNSDELGEPSFPGFTIIQPKRQPKEKQTKPTTAKPTTSGIEVPPPSKPEIPPSN